MSFINNFTALTISGQSYITASGRLDLLLGAVINVNSGGEIQIESGGFLRTDTVSERTSAAGVTVDGVLLKDNGVTASAASIFSTSIATPLLTTTSGDLTIIPSGSNLILSSSKQLQLAATTNQIRLGTTNTTTISATAPASSRTYTVPDSGANSSFVMSDGTQTINGAKTFTGTITINNSGAANFNMGNSTDLSTATPTTINMGGTYSSSAASNIKLRLYDNGSSTFGIGVSLGQMDYVVGSAAAHSFYVNGTPIASVSSSGINTNTINERTAAAGVTIDGLLIKDNVQAPTEGSGNIVDSNGVFTSAVSFKWQRLADKTIRISATESTQTAATTNFMSFNLGNIGSVVPAQRYFLYQSVAGATGGTGMIQVAASSTNTIVNVYLTPNAANFSSGTQYTLRIPPFVIDTN